jgi:hypothetical protein
MSLAPTVLRVQLTHVVTPPTLCHPSSTDVEHLTRISMSPLPRLSDVDNDNDDVACAILDQFSPGAQPVRCCRSCFLTTLRTRANVRDTLGAPCSMTTINTIATNPSSSPVVLYSYNSHILQFIFVHIHCETPLDQFLIPFK